MKKVKTRLRNPNKKTRRKSVFRAIVNIALFVFYFIGATIYRGPGVGFHLAIARKAISLFFSGVWLPQISQLILFPLDSVRYFEFDFFWRIISKYNSHGVYLDISSPRLFSFRLINDRRVNQAVIANPDVADITITKELFVASGAIDLCNFETTLIANLNHPLNHFDTIVCISVLEHIPFDDAPKSLQKIWNLLKPGGRLLLSVPCAKDGFEEYLDINEYQILQNDNDGFVFGQRFYDNEMINSEIFCITGNPNNFAVFGEKLPGTFFNNRKQKFHSLDHPYWREAYDMATQWKYFTGIECLPGVGVIAFEFIKP